LRIKLIVTLYIIWYQFPNWFDKLSLIIKCIIFQKLSNLSFKLLFIIIDNLWFSYYFKDVGNDSKISMSSDYYKSGKPNGVKN